ncbi:MAG: ABC transporter ATP-binding protein, partial [Parasporobacterium sp.]|nr:ABC transporter ATP-binding protein [Parasporobacterium sp.]
LEITNNIVKEHNITCLMITHNMESALTMGNRTIMMNSGKVIYDVSGAEREKETVNSLIDKFKDEAGKSLASDAMLLKNDK